MAVNWQPDLVFSHDAMETALEQFYNSVHKLSSALEGFVTPVEKREVMKTVAQEVANTAEWDKIYLERKKLFASTPLSTEQAVIPIEFKGFVGLCGFIKRGVSGHSKEIGVDREVRLYRGILKITDGSDEVLKQANERKGGQFFGGDKLLVAAGQWFEFEIDHELFYITSFETQKTE